MLPTAEFVPGKRSSLRTCLSHLPLILAGMLLPATAQAQITYTGTAANQNFGSQAIGTTSAAATFSFFVAAGTTVGSIGVVTQGAPNLDFANASGGTCTATTYASTSSCTVNVTFSPEDPGLRQGAVVFFSGPNNTGTVVGSALVYGVGTGPQLAFGFGAPEVIAQGQQNPYTSFGFADPTGMATDAAGDVFVNLGDVNLEDDGGTAFFNSEVLELMPGGGSVGAANVSGNGGLAVDGAGDLFITTAGDPLVTTAAVVETPVGGGASTTIYPVVNGIALSGPLGVTVDATGDLFIADTGNNRVVEVPAGGGAAKAIEPTVDGTGLNSPTDVKLDAASDLYIADQGNNRVVEVPAGGGAAIAIGGVGSPNALALDVLGDLFIVVGSEGQVVEVPAGGGAPFNSVYMGEDCASAPNPISSVGIAMDSAGDLFVSSFSYYYIYDPINPPGDYYYYSFVCEFPRSQPPALSFPTATNEGSIDTTDGTQTVQIQNIGNAALAFSGLSYPADFSEAGGGANACTASTSLTAGQECDVLIEFTPKHTGALSENVTLTDNTLNVAGTKQSIAVTGTGLAATALISPTPGTVLAGPSVTFTWTAGAGATEFDLWLGLSGPGSSSLYTSGFTTATSATANNLPTRGATIYARLFYEIGGVWSHLDYTYTEATSTLAALTSPTPGSTLDATNVQFTWSAGTYENEYVLWLGVAGPGSSDLYSSGGTTALSVTVPSLPAHGAKIYARLFSIGSGGEQFNDYTFTEGTATPGALISPATGSVLGATNVVFTWSAGTYENEYVLWLGVAGPGSSDLYSSGGITALSVTVPSLPAHGAKIYARLFSIGNGGESYNDYTFTEP
jgi:hypothetical protein